MLGFDKPEEPLQEHQVSGAETLLGITFTDGYRRLVREFGGAYGDVEFDIEFPSPGFRDLRHGHRAKGGQQLKPSRQSGKLFRN